MLGSKLRPLAPLVALAALATALPVSTGHAAPNGYPGEKGFADIGYASWDDREPQYRMYPGDILDVSVLSAPELNRTVTVAPDGRISMPLVAPVMVADRSTQEVEASLSQAYAGQLLRPQVSVAVNKATALKVFVAGEVTNPGVYDMPGDIDALQAVVMAGGFKVSAKREKVIIIRRSVGGRPMVRTADLRKAAYHALTADAVPLRRFDIVYVPRTAIANIGLFMQQYFRDGLPIQFTYALNGTQYFTSR
jgi:polysaccharide export outer membrane protein